MLSSNATSIVKHLQIIFFTAAILYFGKTLFIPLFFSLLIAMVLYPLCRWLEERRWPTSLAIAGSLGVVTIVFGTLVWLFYWQIRIFWLDVPHLIKKAEIAIPYIKHWIEDAFGFTESEQKSWLRNASFFNSLPTILKSTLNTTLETLFFLFLVPVFSALFLYHRRIFVRYLQLIVGINHQHKLTRILQEATSTYFRFIKGMVMVYIVVGILNSIGLMALGIKHAILFGMLTAIMTIIPYVGIVVSSLIPISVAWLTKDSLWYPIAVVAVFAVVQYLEANVIFPVIVGIQLNVSTWATLVAVIAGGILWGVSGMILFIPFLAIFKIISDYVEEWKPLNILLSRVPKAS